MKKQKRIEITSADKETLIERIKSNILTAEDRSTLVDLIEFNAWLQFSLQEKTISIWRLQKLFGNSSEKKSKHNKSNNDAPNNANDVSMVDDTCHITSGNTNPSANVAEDTSDNRGTENFDNGNVITMPEQIAKKTSTGKPWPKNSGNIGHDAYTNAEIVEVASCYKHGDACPDKNCSGKLKRTDPKVVVKVSGGDMATTTKFTIQNFQCTVCDRHFSANLPAHVCKDKYDPKFKSMLCIYKHMLGVPNYRLQNYQQYIGTPLPDSTQHDLIEQVVNDIHPAYKYMESLGANASLFHGDDTGVTIKSLILRSAGL